MAPARAAAGPAGSPCSPGGPGGGGARAGAVMNEHRLIACVRRYPLLYDSNHPEYLVFARKAQVWAEIADALGFSANKCKARWNSMRDGYRKSIRKNKLRVRSGEPPMLYKHAKRLEFLRRFLRANGDIEDDNSDVTRLKEEGVEDARSDAGDCSGPADAPSEGPAKNWKGNDVQEASEASVEYYAEDMQEPQLPFYMPREAHPVDAFLGCIGPMLKALPPYYQAMAKAEIFAAAHKYELLNITEAPRAPGGGAAGGGGAPHVPAPGSEASSTLHVKLDPLDEDLLDTHHD